MKPNYISILSGLGLAGCVLTGSSTVSHVWAQGATTSWSGPYAGLSFGGGGGHSAQRDFYTPPGGGGGEGGLGDGSYGTFGAMGGGIIGYNYQVGQYVFGVEGGIYGSTISGSSNTCGGVLTPFHQCGTNISAEADVRGRIGYAIGQFLPFVTGGFAAQDIHAYDAFFGTSGSSWKPGFAVGGGVEYKLTPQLAVRLEYLHTEIGSQSIYNIAPGVPENVSSSTDTVRFGISYNFWAPTAPIIAKY